MGRSELILPDPRPDTEEEAEARNRLLAQAVALYGPDATVEACQCGDLAYVRVVNSVNGRRYYSLVSGTRLYALRGATDDLAEQLANPIKR